MGFPNSCAITGTASNAIFGLGIAGLAAAGIKFVAVKLAENAYHQHMTPLFNEVKREFAELKAYEAYLNSDDPAAKNPMKKK